MGYMIYEDLIVIYPKPYSIYLRGTIISGQTSSRVWCLTLTLEIASMPGENGHAAWTQSALG